MEVNNLARQSRATAIRRFFASVSIEPILFLYNFQIYAVNVIKENLKLGRFCRITLGHDEDECANLNDGHHDDLQIEVQKLDSVFLFYEKIVATVVPILLMSFIASWSDRRGRKVPLLLSFMGSALNLIVYLTTVLNPSWPPEVLLGAAFLNSVGGGWVMANMAAYSYIADKTKNQSRTFRMAVMDACMHLGDPCGTAVGAWLFSLGGYVCVYSFALTLMSLCIVLTMVILNDTRPQATENEEIKSPWNPKNVVDLFRSCFRKRPGRGRLHIILLFSFMLGLISSRTHNLYLWCRRVLLWDERQFSLYQTITQLVEIIVMFAVSPLIDLLRLHDCSVGAGATFLVLVKMMAFGLLTETSQWWVLYLFVFIPLGLTVVANKGLLSKLCAQDEVGRLFSMMAILEVLWPPVDSAIYTSVYSSTLAFYPSYEHLVGAGFAFYVFSGFLMMRLSTENEKNYKNEEDVEKSEKHDGN